MSRCAISMDLSNSVSRQAGKYALIDPHPFSPRGATRRRRIRHRFLALQRSRAERARLGCGRVGSGAASWGFCERFDSFRRLRAVNRLLLDTTVFIDLSKGAGDVLTSLNALVTTGAILGISAVSVAEFFAGVPVAERGRWQRWLSDLEYRGITREAAVPAGAFRFELARQGRTLHIPNALMAATGIVMDATLVTSNIKEYPMPNLRLLRLGS